MARLKWVLGNWKQNLLREPAAAVAQGIAGGLTDALGGATDVRVGVAPTFVALEAVRPHSGAGPAQLRLLAQDCAAQESGAYTGEVGPAMLLDAGVHAAIIGHSERRAYYGDTDEAVAAKVSAARTAGLATVLCVGEQLEQRDAGEHESVVISQLSAALNIGLLDPERFQGPFELA